MAEQSAVVHQVGKKAYIAGLNWQPLARSGYSKRVADIREYADRIDATKHILLKGSQSEYLGLYNYDPDISDEERTGQVFSLASMLASQSSPDDHSIYAIRIEDGLKKGQLALVVIEQGAPSMDLIGNDAEVSSTIDTYTNGSIESSEYQVYSNATELFPGALPLDIATQLGNFNSKHALTGLPTDLIKASGVLAVVLLLAGGLYGGNEYLEASAREARMKQAQASIQTPQYLNKLAVDKRNVGLGNSDAMEMLDLLSEQPFMARGWLLESIQCDLGKCASIWQTQGGYTQELVSFLNNQQASPDPKDVNKLKFSFSYDMTPKGIDSLQDLPGKQTASDLLYLEQQAWQKAGLKFKVDTQGQTWPAGFKSIPPNVSVNRHAAEVTGSLTLMKDFLDRYPSGVYWNQISMKIEPKNLDAAVMVTLKGALYAY
jgi:hypothetical protein